jgi:hypothetical protein
MDMSSLEIAVCLSPAARSRFDTYVPGHDEERPESTRIRSLLAAASTVFDSVDGARLYRWEAIDWDPDRDHRVAAIFQFLDGLFPFDFLFLRIGSDPECIWKLGEFDRNPFGLRIHRTLVFKDDLPEAPAADLGSDKSLNYRLTCPRCGFAGFDGAEHGGGFRLLEDVTSHWEITRVTANVLCLREHYQSGDHYDGGSNPRVECRNCLAEFPVPRGLSVNW